MRYQEMSPSQIREAIAKNTPVALCIGNLEFHSEHLPVGTDGQVGEGILNRVAARHPDMVLLPPFYYGTSSYAVADSTDGRGTVSMDSMIVCQFAENLFANLLEIGFRNVHGFYYHQSENFAQGMPTDLAFRFAGRRAIFAYLERTRGRGWWGRSEMKNYYDSSENIFDWIQIHPVVDPAVEKKFGSDHAGRVETSAMMELLPDLVHMEKLSTSDWFTENAGEASRAYGAEYIHAAVLAIEKLLYPAVK